MTEKELEKLFKSKLDGRDFPFNPENWERMEAVLDGQKPLAGAYYWRSVAAILLFALFAGTWVSLQNADIITNQPIAPIVLEDKQTTSPKGNNIQKPTQAINSQVNDSPIKEGINDVESSLTDEMINEINQNEVIAAETGATSSSKESSYNNNSQTINSSVTENAFAAAALQREENELLMNAEPSISTGAEGSRVLDSLLNLAPKVPHYVANLETSTNLKEGEGFTPDALKKFEKQQTWFVKGGPVFNDSYVNDEMSVGYQAGVGYQLNFKSNWRFQTSVNYVQLNGVGLNDKQDSVLYTFGKQVIETEQQTQALKYIEMPLRIAYQINAKHSIGTGIFAGYLVGSEQKYTRLKTVVESNTVSNQSEQSKELNENLNRWNVGLHFFYEYKMAPGLSLGLNVHQGLADISNNVTESYRAKHKTLNTRVVFKYELF